MNENETPSPAPLQGIPEALHQNQFGPIGLVNTANGPQLGGYQIGVDLFQILSLLQQTSNRQDLVDALKRIIVQMLAEQAQRELEKQIGRGIDKISQPGFWSKLFGKK